VELPAGIALPNRPPQLCDGCPHGDSLEALRAALKEFAGSLVASDIGCYTLGALPPYSAIESCVCMGASIGMAKGAAEAGLRPAVAVIGDSTFLHSGITPLIDAVAADADMTLVIVDNQAVAMTGGQQTVLPSSSLKPLVLGLGVPAEHCHVLKPHHTQAAANTEIIRRELEHRGLSVIIAVRECIETAKARKKASTEAAV
jgi:indolepyruvate ferredoxin oxidoreductase alpha subunit